VQKFDCLIDQLGIYQWAIGCDSNNDIGSMADGHMIIPAEDVAFIAASKFPTPPFAIFPYGLIGESIRGRDYDFVRSTGLGHATNDSVQHCRASDIH
jgi:hypothetical protein